MDDDADNDADDDEAEEEAGGKKKLLVLIILALVLVLFLGGGAVLYFTGLLDSLLGIEQQAAVDPQTGAPVDAAATYTAMVDGDGNPLGPILVGLPEFLINWETNGKRVAYLKLIVALEVANPADAMTAEGTKERLYEDLTRWLREQRYQDIEGADGMFRLREEFFIRSAQILQGIQLRDVVIRSILLQ